MEVRDDGEILEVELKGLDANGQLPDTMRVQLRCLEGKCETLPWICGEGLFCIAPRQTKNGCKSNA